MKTLNVRVSKFLACGVLFMFVAWLAAAAGVKPALIATNATYVPVSTPGGGHKSFVYVVSGLTPGSSYSLATDGTATEIDNFYALNPAKSVHLSTKSGTNTIVSAGDTICFYGTASKSVNCKLNSH